MQTAEMNDPHFCGFVIILFLIAVLRTLNKIRMINSIINSNWQHFCTNRIIPNNNLFNNKVYGFHSKTNFFK